MIKNDNISRTVQKTIYFMMPSALVAIIEKSKFLTCKIHSPDQFSCIS